MIDTSDEDPDPFRSIDCWPAGSITFSPDPDPTCNNGYIELFHLEQNINKKFNKFKLKMVVYKIEFYAYLPKI